MRIRKLCGSLAVTISIFALSSAASAGEYFTCVAGDRQATIDGIRDMAVALRCESTATAENPGLWPGDNPIWQWKNKPAMGCVVHGKLARLLFENRTGDGPPRKNKHDTNTAKGAAHDLIDGKDLNAQEQLLRFVTDIGGATENPPHEQDAQDFSDSAMEAYYCIDTL